MAQDWAFAKTSAEQNEQPNSAAWLLKIVYPPGTSLSKYEDAGLRPLPSMGLKASQKSAGQRIAYPAVEGTCMASELLQGALTNKLAGPVCSRLLPLPVPQQCAATAPQGSLSSGEQLCGLAL